MNDTTLVGFVAVASRASTRRSEPSSELGQGMFRKLDLSTTTSSSAAQLSYQYAGSCTRRSGRGAMTSGVPAGTPAPGQPRHRRRPARVVRDVSPGPPLRRRQPREHERTCRWDDIVRTAREWRHSLIDRHERPSINGSISFLQSASGSGGPCRRARWSATSPTNCGPRGVSIATPTATASPAANDSNHSAISDNPRATVLERPFPEHLPGSVKHARLMLLRTPVDTYEPHQLHF